MSLEFKPITAKDIDRLTPFYMMRRNRTCDSVFLESFLWREYYNVRYAIWEERALLWLMEYKGRVFSAMPLCREEDLEEAFGELERYFNEELHYPLVINLADEEAVRCLNLPPERYLVKEEEGAYDYLYSAESLKTLAGKKLHKKKNHLNSFIKKYEGRYEYRTLTCEEIQDVWKFLDRWREGKGEDVEEHLDFEVRGIHEILRNCCSLNIRMGGIYVDGELEAFSIGSYNPTERMAVIHIEKANSDMRGLYQLINQQFLIREFPEAEIVNREDDLGIEGLRKAKMSYCPIDFARKYLVEQVSFGESSEKGEGFGWAEHIGALAGDEEERLQAAGLGENTLTDGKMEEKRRKTGEKTEQPQNSHTEEICYADETEKQECRGLWHEAFPDDSVPFADYYFKEKVRDNRILIKREEGKLASMLHLNPYTFVCREGRWRIDYIVGVATAKDRRHRGHMASLLRRMMEDMNQEGVPFTFLMPASEAIYRPFQFAFIYRQPKFRLTREAKERLFFSPLAADGESGETKLAASYMEEWLGARYEAYCSRDEAYVKRLVKELASEDGTLELMYDGERLCGLFSEWGLGEREQRLLYTEASFAGEDRAGEKPAIMARITDVEAFFQMLSGKDEAEYRRERSDRQREADSRTEPRRPDGVLGVRDPFLAACDGYYNIFIEGGHARAEKRASGKGSEREEEILNLSIDSLARWLFGYRGLDEILESEGRGGQTPEWAGRIRPIDGVLIDEVV